MSPVLNCRYSPREPRAQGKAGLRQLGPQVEIALFQLGEPAPEEGHPQPVTGRALIDTGASVTCVDQEAAETAGLSIVGSGPMTSATHEREIVPIYAGKIRITGFLEVETRSAMGANLRPQGLIALIGRDLPENCVLVVNGPDGAFSLSI